MPTEVIPMEHGVFDAIIVRHNRVRSVVWMNPSHPESLIRYKMKKPFGEG